MMINTQKSFYYYSAWVCLMMGMIAMGAWVFSIDWIVSGFPGLPTMKFNTALCFALAGGINLLHAHAYYKTRLMLIVVLIVLTLIELSEILYAFDFGVLNLFILDGASQGNDGNMSYGTAISFISFGVASLFVRMNQRRRQIYGQYLLHFVTALSSMSLLGYVYGLDNTERMGFLSTMSLPTTVLFIVLSISTTHINKELGLTGLLTGSNSGNLLARRMFWIITLLVFIIGFGVLMMINHEIIKPASAITLFGIIMLMVSLSAISSNALQINTRENEKKRLADELSQMNTQLEQRVEERNQSSKKLLDLLTETNRVAQIGGWELDLVKGVVTWSSMTKQIHEVASDFVPTLTEGINFYKEGESRKKISKAVNDAMGLGIAWDLELQIITATGNEKWVRAIGTPAFEDGKCIRLNGTFQDITDRKTAELNLAQEHSFLQMVINHLPANVYAKDREGRITLINNQEVVFLNKQTPEQILGKPIDDLVSKEYAAIIKEEDLSIIDTGSPILSKEVLVVKPDGETVWLLKSKLPIRDHQNFITGILGIDIDITARKSDEEKLRNITVLESKSKEMEQFAYIASHDLREPLLSIKNHAELLVSEHRDELGEEAQYKANLVIRAAYRMEDLIRSLLDYSRLSKVKKLEQVDCQAIVNDVLEDLSSLINTNDAQIVVHKLPVLNAYPVELKLLFQNLIGNAIKFRKKDVRPSLDISGEKVARGWQFEVKDNGIGIKESHLNKIFIIFRRLHKRSVYEGTGIGLANAKKIVETHNGTIWVESKFGAGSTFCFTILTEK